MNKEFWEERTLKYGHTSWADFRIYIYEYFLKKRFLTAYLKEKRYVGKALDFGGGIGDYTKVLRNFMNDVYMIEISQNAQRIAKTRIRLPVTYATSTIEVKGARFQFCLIMNVIQHMSKVELSELEAFLSDSMISGGEVLILNSFTADKNVKINNYTYLYNSSMIVDEFEKNEFDLVSKSFFWSPYEKGLRSWRVFNFIAIAFSHLKVVPKPVYIGLAWLLSTFERPLSSEKTIQQVLIFRRR